MKMPVPDEPVDIDSSTSDEEIKPEEIDYVIDNLKRITERLRSRS